MFEKRVPRRIFGPKRDEVTGEYRKLHNEELNDLYSSPNIVWCDKVEKNEMDKACSTYGERSGVYRILVGKPKGKRPLGRPRRRWEDNIKMDIQEVRSGGMNWIELAKHRKRWTTVSIVKPNRRTIFRDY